MECSKCEDLIYDYLDNELDFETTEQMAGHFKKCSSCNEKLLTIQQGLSLFRTEMSSLKLDKSFSEKVMSQISEEEASNFWLYVMFGFSSIIALGLLLLTIAFYSAVQITIKYLFQFALLGFGMVSVLSMNNLFLIIFAVTLPVIAIAMREIMQMEEGKV